MRITKIFVLLTLISTLVVSCSQNSPVQPAGNPALHEQSPESPTGLLEGFVFVDTDSNGVLDASEAGWGVANVSVYITDSLNNTTVVQTDSEGRYFLAVPGGTYTVEVLALTPQADFNEELFASYDPSTALEAEVTFPVASGPLGANFGFNPRVQELLQKFEEGEYESTGMPVEYWRRQIVLALTKLNPPVFGQPNPEEPDFDAAALLAFLNQIEGLAFEDPFMFDDGTELKSALLILGDTSGAPLAEFLKSLLAFEFNHVAGYGLVGHPGLQETILNFAESVYIQQGGLSPSSKKLSLAPTYGDGNLTQTKLLLDEFNRGGGGGPVQ